MGQKSPFSIDLRYRPNNSERTSDEGRIGTVVLHVKIKTLFASTVSRK